MMIDTKIDKTVVTACDHNFVWGAVLLGLSLRYYGMDCCYHVLGYDLPESDIRILESIPNTKVFSTQKSSSRSVCTQKPMAVATADTEFIIWMDADCIVTGNVDKYLVCPEGKFQIRFRSREENASVYRNHYCAGDKWGDIPMAVLEQWQKDVDDLTEPMISTVSQTNCIVMTRQHVPFIDLWKTQMFKVIPETTKGVYAKDSIAYSMTDESTINSLFAFSSRAPETTEYLLDKDETAYCAHFGLMPKPWQHFTLPTYRYYDQIQKFIQHARDNGIKLPPLPDSFDPKYRSREYLRARIQASYRIQRYKTSTLIRRALKLFK